jgi:hypothetical protein
MVDAKFKFMSRTANHDVSNVRPGVLGSSEVEVGARARFPACYHRPANHDVSNVRPGVLGSSEVEVGARARFPSKRKATGRSQQPGGVCMRRAGRAGRKRAARAE